MRNLFRKKQGNTPTRATGPFVAIDFDRAWLRIVEARPTRGRCEVVRLVLAPMPDQLNLSDGAAVGPVVAKALRDASVRATTLVMGVPRSQAVLKPLSLPRMADLGEVASVVQLQLDGQLPFPNEEAVVDFAPGAHDEPEPPRPPEKQASEDADGNAAATMEVLAAAVQQGVVKRYNDLAAAAGLKLACLSLRPYANAACLAQLFPPAEAVTGESAAPAEAPAPDRVRAMVTLMSDEVETTILADGHVVFSRSAALPPGAPTDAAATQAMRALQSYQALHPDRRITSVFIAGDLGAEAEIARRVGDTLKVPASLLEPQRAMQLPEVSGGEGRGNATAFTAPLGLAFAFANADAAFLPFDFINPKKPTPLGEGSRSSRSLMALTAVTAVLFVFTLGFLSLKSKRDEVRRLEDRLASLQPDKKRVATLSKRVDAIDKWLKQPVDPLTHWANLSSLFPPAQDAFINALRTDNDGVIAFTVRARNQQVVDSLGPRFADRGYKSLPGSVATRGDSPDAPGYSFVTDVKISPTGKQKIDVSALTAPPRPADDINAMPPAPKEPPAAPAANPEDHARPHNPEGGAPAPPLSPAERWRRGKQKGGGS